MNTKKELLKLNTEFHLIQFMIDYMKESNDSIKLLPSNIGLTDVVFLNLLIYNSLVIEKIKY